MKPVKQGQSSTSGGNLNTQQNQVIRDLEKLKTQFQE